MPVALIGAAASAIGGIAAAGGIAGFTFLGLSGIGGVLARVAVSFVLSSLSSKFASKPKKNRVDAGNFAIKATDRTQQIKQPITMRRFLWGEVRVSGPVVFAASTSSNKYLHLVIPVAAHEVDGIDEVWINGEVIATDQIDGSGNVDDGKFSGKVRIKKHLGTAAQTADSDLVSEVSEWTSDHRGRGVAYVYVRLEWDRELYPTGQINISAVVRGRKMYDTRDSMTRWSPNPALMAYDFLTDTQLGCKADSDDIGTDEVDAAANSCEESVTVQNEDSTVSSIDTSADIITLEGDYLKLQRADTVRVFSTGSVPTGLSAGTDYYVIPYQFGEVPRIQLATSLDNAIAGTAIDITGSGSGSITVRKIAEPRYFGGGTVDADDLRGEAVRDILSAMGGDLVNTGGYWKIFPAVWRSPTVTLDEGHSRAPMKVQTKISRRDRFNTVKGIYSSPLNFWQPSDYPAVTDPAYVTADNGEILTADIEQPFTQRPFQASRIAKIALKKHRNETSVDYYCKMDGIQFQPTDTLQLDDAFLGFSAEEFEVKSWKLAVEERGGVQTLGVDMGLQITAETDYDWDSSEEATLPNTSITTLTDPFTVTVPTGFSLDSEAIVTLDGDLTWKVKASWQEHQNSFVSNGGRFELWFKKSTDSVYASAGRVDGNVTEMQIPQLAPDTAYDFQLYAYNKLGRPSEAAPIGGFVAGTTVTTNVEDWENNTEARDPQDLETDSDSNEDWES